MSDVTALQELETGPERIANHKTSDAYLSQKRRVGRQMSVPRYRLVSVDGRCLHFSGQGLTDNRAWAWVGPKSKIAALRRRGVGRDLTPVEVSTP